MQEKRYWKADMPLQDANRWDARYKENSRYSNFEKPRPFLVEHAELLPTHGLALDVAMGLGGNAELLLQRGLKVIGIDISGVALRRARQRLPCLMAIQADLTQFYLPANHFDVILNFFYLQRDLWPSFMRALRPNGWLIFETLTIDFRSVQPGIDPKYLLAPEELRRAFPSLEVIDYQEGWSMSDDGHWRSVAGLVAHKRME
jgi:tellurite methyltransferase